MAFLELEKKNKASLSLFKIVEDISAINMGLLMHSNISKY